MTPNFASQMRVAFSSIVWNTGVSSPGELEMTRSTSEVAVCCSSASLRSSVRWRSSLSRRVFSMAMTAWRGEILNQLDLLVGEWADLLPVNSDGADQPVFLEHGHSELRPRATEFGLWGGTRRFQHVNCVNYLPRSAQHIEV